MKEVKSKLYMAEKSSDDSTAFLLLSRFRQFDLEPIYVQADSIIKLYNIREGEDKDWRLSDPLTPSLP